MKRPIDLRTIIQMNGKIRSNETYLTSSIEMSELQALINHEDKKRVPNSFMVKGREKTIEMFLNGRQMFEGQVEWWTYISTESVKSKVGERKFALTVFNDC